MKALLLLCALITQTALAADYVGPVEIPTGTKRDAAQVFLPLNHESRSDWPVLLVLHGYLASSGMMERYLAFSSQVTKHGFVLILANGFKDKKGLRFWNATDGCCNFDHAEVDDVSYLTGLVAQVRAQFHLRGGKNFLFGHSNGGFMAHRLACESGGMVDGLVSLAGVTWKDPLKCQSTRPVSVLQIHALDDGTIKYAGDKGYPGLAPYPGAEDTIAQWVARNQCSSAPEAGPALDLTNSIPGEDADPRSYRGCVGGSRVALWTIRAYDSILHSGHTPRLSNGFTDLVLDFLLR